ncbi:hypothetical protein [Martelella mangrovi]|uniref:Uncharacterized protein n=1 Tax=Martelella mangrovi TaxID=1397477 RepID=A0ABV2I917_9HYPH|nr:hypothetical protein [uncultured Martelella sp.]
MLDRLMRFFKRFTSPKVSEKEVGGVKHVIDNIDHSFDPNRPTPERHSGEQNQG